MGEQAHAVTLKSFFHHLYKRIHEDRVLDLAAQLAYFFLLSLFPFLIFTFTVLPYIGLTTDQMLPLIGRFAPDELMDLVKNNLENVLQQRGSLLSFSVIATLWPTSTAVVAIIRILNRAYNVNEDRSFFVARFLALILTFALLFVFVFALVINVFGPVIGKYIFNQLGIPDNIFHVWDLLRILFSFLVIILVFASLYYFAPNRKLHFSNVIIGAVIAAAGWQVASLAFSVYVDQFGRFSATYGTLGGIIVLMIWFYITAFIIILGGEINAVLQHFKDKRDSV